MGVEERRARPDTILCECGHSLYHHSAGANDCYVSTRRTEKRGDHHGNIVKVKCVYVCHCKEFKWVEETQKGKGVKDGN